MQVFCHLESSVVDCVSATHLSDENPDQPQSECDPDHDAVPDEIEKSVVFTFDNDQGFHLLEKKIKKGGVDDDRSHFSISLNGYGAHLIIQRDFLASFFP